MFFIEEQKRVMITGGAGFIGSHVADALLSAGHEVFVLDNLSTGTLRNVPEGATFLPCDILDRRKVRHLFAEIRPHWVSHQAAQISVSASTRDPYEDAKINILGLLNILDASVACFAERFAFASSGGVLYGNVDAPASETAPAQPISPYGIAKQTGESYCRFYAQRRGLEVNILRYANVYGPRQNPKGEAGVVAIFCARMLDGSPCVIHGDGMNIRDYVYVRDVAEANRMALEASKAGGTFNIGTGCGTTVHELFDVLQKVAGVNRQPFFDDPRPGDLKSSLLNYSEAKRVLGWHPGIELAAGLDETYRWFKSNVETSV